MTEKNMKKTTLGIQLITIILCVINLYLLFI